MSSVLSHLLGFALNAIVIGVFLCLAISYLWRKLGWLWPKPTPPPEPPSVTVSGVRIPGNGSSPHLLRLETVKSPGAWGTDCFLFHIPDLHHYWQPKIGWQNRDTHRFTLELKRETAEARHRQLLEDLKQQRELYKSGYTAPQMEPLHLGQRQRQLSGEQFHHLIHHRYAACVGPFYVFYSWALNDLPENVHVPAWVCNVDVHVPRRHFGDVFIVKMSPQEHAPNGWAIYEDIGPDFLKLLQDGPLESWKVDVGSDVWWFRSSNGHYFTKERGAL
jgi:hypothetical protein